MISAKRINFNGSLEKVFNLKNLQLYSRKYNPRIAVLGYGSQGNAQSHNLKMKKFDVCLGLRPDSKSFNLAKNDGWIPGKNLFSIDEACQQSEQIHYLLSDKGQIDQWDTVKKYLTESKTLCFSHGFGIVFNEQTKIVPPSNIDVIMVAPKASGVTLKTQNVNCSYAIHQDFSGNAFDKVITTAWGINCNNLFETTFQKEVFSDLTGERSVLMGMILGAFKAQYDVLISKGHSKNEAWNETVEEALNSLYTFINKVGPEELINNCSYTARIGCLDWMDKFEKVIKPVIKDCYNKVESGEEAKRVIEFFSDDEAMKKLQQKVDDVCQQDIWQTGKEMRKLR